MNLADQLDQIKRLGERVDVERRRASEAIVRNDGHDVALAAARVMRDEAQLLAIAADRLVNLVIRRKKMAELNATEASGQTAVGSGQEEALATREPTQDEAAGMAWWNRQPDENRGAWLAAAAKRLGRDDVSPSDAWAEAKRQGVRS